MVKEFDVIDRALDISSSTMIVLFCGFRDPAGSGGNIVHDLEELRIFLSWRGLLPIGLESLSRIVRSS